MAYKPYATKHLEVLVAVREFVQKERRSPSLGELCKKTGITSKAQVCNALRRLEREGFIERRTPFSKVIKLSYRGQVFDWRKYDSDLTRAKKAEGGKKARALQGNVLARSKTKKQMEEMARIEAVVAKAMAKERDGGSVASVDVIHDFRRRGTMKVSRLG